MATIARRARESLATFCAEYRASYWPATEAEARLVSDQIGLALEASKASIFAGPLTAILMAMISLQWFPLEWAVIWPCIFVATSLISGLIYAAAEKRTGNGITDIGKRARLFAWLSFAQTVAWCTMGFLLWVPGDQTNHAIVGLGIAASLTAWTTIASYHFATGVIGFPLFFVVLSCDSFMSGRFQNLAIVVVYWLLMATLFNNNYFTRRKLLLLEYERAHLVADLEEAKSQSDRARERAEKASRAKSSFLANMSHELRTPLNAILGFSEIIQTKALGPSAVDQYSEYGGYIHGSGQHLLALINDILDLSKIEAGKLDLNETAVDLRRVTDDSIRLHLARSQAAGSSLTTDVDPGFPQVWADERAIRQILANLVSNAVKFTPSGGRIVCFAHVEADGSLAFGVSDTGVGIAPEDQARVFESFGQGRHDAVTADKGTGLGLAIVRGLATAHGGQVALESAPHRGTRVTIALPRERARAKLRAAV